MSSRNQPLSIATDFVLFFFRTTLSGVQGEKARSSRMSRPSPLLVADV